MKQDHLGKHFVVTPTWIAPRQPDTIQEDDFRHAIIEFFESAFHMRVRKGDLLIEFKRCFPTKIRSLMTQLEAQGLAAIKSCYNSMTLAKTYKPRDRVATVTDGHIETLKSVKNEKERDRLLKWVVDSSKKGKPVTVKELQRKVRSKPPLHKTRLRHAQK